MRISTFSMDDNGEMRRVCVVGGQPFYQSTGASSSLPGAWLPFCGVINDQLTEFTEKIQKPSVAHNRRAKISDYFPAEIAAVVREYGSKPDVWGRYQNIKSLIVTCMLSPDSMPPEIKNAVLNYIQPNTLPKPEFVELQLNIPLDDAHVNEINDKLIEMGAEPIEYEGYESVFGSYVLMKECEYVNNNFDCAAFIKELRADHVAARFKHRLQEGRSVAPASSSDDQTDREGFTPRSFDND